MAAAVFKALATALISRGDLAIPLQVELKGSRVQGFDIVRDSESDGSVVRSYASGVEPL